jgi:3-hydroxyacyl-CoA dehydrogenase/enoyl-CoA hydratase/3-hydroxybutyryl-CoA epimerase
MEGAAMLGEGIPAAVIERRRAGRPAGGPAGGAGRDRAVAVGARHRADPRRPAAEGKAYDATPGERLVERMVKELGRSGRAAGGGFYDYPQGAKSTCGPS